MNIGVVVDNDFDDDIRVGREVEILKAGGHQVFVLCFGYSDKKYEDNKDITVQRVVINRKVRDAGRFFMNILPAYEWMWAREIGAFIQKFNIAAIHAHDLYMSKASREGIVRSGVPSVSLVLDLHENYPVAIHLYNWTKGWLRKTMSQPGAWQKKEKDYLAYADRIIILSERFKATLLDRYSFLEQGNLTAVPNVVNLRRFEKFSIDESKARTDSVTFLYFGAVAERRGVFDAIEAIRTARERGSDAELLIVGPVEKADAGRFSSALKVPEKQGWVRHVPWIELPELPTYLFLSDVCLSPLWVNPQHESGIANKLFQYMFGARPIIVSSCKPQQELIENARCGIVYESQEEFVEAIIELAGNAEKRTRMGENAKSALYNNYDNGVIETKLLGVYDSLNGRQRLNNA